MRNTPQFVFAKNLSVGTRLVWIAVLAAIGVAVQLFFSVFVGWALVLVAVLLGLAKNVSNSPGTVRGGDWQNVTIAEIERVQELMESGERLKRSAGAWSCASAMGCFWGVVLLAGAAFVTVVLAGLADNGLPSVMIVQPVARGGSVALLFGLDALTLFVPIWISGRVSAWEPPYMRLKLAQLMHIYQSASSNPQLEFQPSLQVAKTADGSVPTDCKLMAKLKDADPSFMGIQIQTSLNDVQGTKHPYTYCVLIAKPEFDLIRKAKRVVETPPGTGFIAGLFADANEKKELRFSRFQGAVVELKREGDVEIAVVRQKTSGTGYKTSPDQAMKVFSAAYQLALGVLQQ